jgi:hypothetical protein
MPTHAVLCRIGLNKSLDFQTIADKRKLLEVPDLFSRMKPVGLLHSELRHKYKVMASDQVEARYIFDPVFMENFAGIAEHLGAEDISVSFYKDELFIVAAGDRDFFEIGTLSKPLEPKDIEPLVRHLDVYIGIIDLLNLQPEHGI